MYLYADGVRSLQARFVDGLVAAPAALAADSDGEQKAEPAARGWADGGEASCQGNASGDAEEEAAVWVDSDGAAYRVVLREPTPPGAADPAAAAQ